MYELNQIRQMAERIKAGLPCRVLVFGSYAWGRPNACSDVDLAVVVPDDLEIKHPARIVWPPGPTCRISAGLKMFSHFSDKWIKNATNLA
jgi:hypothetical protein